MGKGFGATAGVVKLGSTAAMGTDIRSWSDTKVEFRVPANSGNGITLQNTVGQVSNGLSFTTRSTGKVYFVSKGSGTIITMDWPTVRRRAGSVPGRTSQR